MSAELPEWAAQAIGSTSASVAPTIVRLGSEKTFGKSGFALTSPAFQNGAELDPSFTACEEDSVAPPFEWTAPPPGAQELVLIAEDLQSTDGKPNLHWLVWGLAPQKGKLLEGEVPPRTGKNGLGNSEWLLPNPPLGEEHRYIFQLFALDLPLTTMPGASYEELVSSMEGTIMACAMITARFEGHEMEEWDPDNDDWDDE
ncbi:YbhB/YbcL family Raf kinase inhibitor-like protein [Erythrobacter sp. W53]|uniref:YbhB/YbcL family Raf kinase inhibitor-like protein n=1 Tax=Erythrobacter sp. W53 TaxID=3425947 RepID=UPI003D769818